MYNSDNKFNVSASSVISNSTLCCSFLNTFVFQQGRYEFEQRPCNILGNLSPEVTENGGLPTSTCYANGIS